MNIHLIGTGNPTGEHLIRMLKNKSEEKLFIYSKSNKNNYFLNLEHPSKFKFQSFNENGVLVSLAPIWLLASFIETINISNISSIIAISSTSVITKRFAFNNFDRSLVKNLSEAEKKLKKFVL